MVMLSGLVTNEDVGTRPNTAIITAVDTVPPQMQKAVHERGNQQAHVHAQSGLRSDLGAKLATLPWSDSRHPLPTQC